MVFIRNVALIIGVVMLAYSSAHEITDVEICQQVRSKTKEDCAYMVDNPDLRNVACFFEGALEQWNSCSHTACNLPDLIVGHFRCRRQCPEYFRRCRSMYL